MRKAVIFDMYETLITHFKSPRYAGKQTAEDMDIPEKKFREIWDPTDYARTIGKMTLEEEFFLQCTNALGVELSECLYVGDGGNRELETAEKLGMKPVQAVWYLQQGSRQPVWRKPEFLQAESPMEVLQYLT